MSSLNNDDDDDGVTIEDDSDEQIDRSMSTKTSFVSKEEFFSIICVVLLVILLLSLIRSFVKGRRSSSTHVVNHVDPQRRFEDLERVRQRQQQLYEQQMKMIEQKKEEKVNSMKDLPRTSFRRSDHNPLTGQTSSCSSTSQRSTRKPTTGG